MCASVWTPAVFYRHVQWQSRIWGWVDLDFEWKQDNYYHERFSYLHFREKRQKDGNIHYLTCSLLKFIAMKHKFQINNNESLEESNLYTRFSLIFLSVPPSPLYVWSSSVWLGQWLDIVWWQVDRENRTGVWEGPTDGPL